MSARHHTLDIYEVELYQVNTRREWSTLRRKLMFLDPCPTSMGSTSWAMWTPKGPGKAVAHLVLFINVIDHGDDALELVNTCAHEAAHGASRILEWIGHDKAGDEPHAYLLAWLTRWLVEGVEWKH